MVAEKVSFGNCIIFALALAEVTSWTIDLPEVRKYVFEKNEREKEKEKELDDYKKEEVNKPIYYSNIDGNSKHNSKHYDDIYEKTAYAREYGYESYMEKKVHDIVYNGSVYLEGLRRSLENYTTFLESCTRANSTVVRTSQNTTNWRPSIELFNSSSSNSSSTNSTSSPPGCREASSKSEHVRRLAELAMWAARELQDIAYARRYHKGDDTSLGMEENELILKLAWFLDRLAHFTGYEPEPTEFLRKPEETTTTSTVAPTPPTILNASAEVTRQMMECLKNNSSADAVERCRYPDPLPPLVQMMMEMNSNITGIPAMPVPPPNMNDQVMPISRTSRSDPLSDQSMELLVAADDRAPSVLNFPPSLTAVNVRRVQKRSVLSMVKPEEDKSAGNKNSIFSSLENDPMIHFLKYYAKHKVWEGANLDRVDRKFQEFEVKNHLATHSIQKRAIDEKMKHLRLPENPFQDLSKYIKHKSGINYVKDEAIAEKIKSTLAKMDEKPFSKILIKRLTKIVRPKRSVTYEKDVDLPRESVDPQKDISYYTKNKEGRNYNNDLRQAVLVRAGLEQIFNTGNIEVVRRYGANYNPANPNPFLFGIIISQADF